MAVAKGARVREVAGPQIRSAATRSGGGTDQMVTGRGAGDHRSGCTRQRLLPGRYGARKRPPFGRGGPRAHREEDGGDGEAGGGAARTNRTRRISVGGGEEVDREVDSRYPGVNRGDEEEEEVEAKLLNCSVQHGGVHGVGRWWRSSTEALGSSWGGRWEGREEVDWYWEHATSAKPLSKTAFPSPGGQLPGFG